MLHRLTAREVLNSEPGLLADGGGLYLQTKGASGGGFSRSWLFRYTAPNGKRREMGLGSLATVSLAEARSRALDARKLVEQGVDPLERRDADIALRRKAVGQEAREAGAPTFREVAKTYLTRFGPGIGPKTYTAWKRYLGEYINPVMGDVRVDRIDINLVRKALDPIWIDKRVTATRVRSMIHSVLAFATTAGLRQGDNPAAWTGNLKFIYPALSARAVEHHPAVPWRDMPNFWDALSQRSGSAAQALRFLILCCSRYGEAVYMRLGEVDFDHRVWTVPAERMKGRDGKRQPHIVPLSIQAMAVLEPIRAAGYSPTQLAFPSHKGAKLSPNALGALIHRMGRSEVPHGFRTSFRTWAAEGVDADWETAERCLAHQVGSAVSRAYNRASQIDKRRKLLQDWADFVTRQGSAGSA